MPVKPDRLLYCWLRDNEVITPLSALKIRFNEQGHKIISKGLSESGYDLELGDCITVVKQHPIKRLMSYFLPFMRIVLDPFNPVEMLDVELKRDRRGRLYYDLPPNSFCLRHSAEYMSIPLNAVALAFGKSTYARDGKGMPMTPLEAGWKGHVTIEIANLTRYWSRIYVGMGICQVIFLPLEANVSVPYDGVYQGQTAKPLPGQVF